MTAIFAFAFAGETLAQATPRRVADAAPSFRALYEEHAPAVARLCRRMLGAQRGEDACAEVFLRAQGRAAQYDRARPFRAWLLAVAAHYCVDCLRRGAIEGRIFSPQELDAGTLPTAAPSPLSSLLARERQRALHTALDALPPQLRAVLALRYFAGLSYAEMADALEISRAQVGVILFRAKARVRAELGLREDAP